MCLAYVVRKFDFWLPHLRGNPYLGTANCFKFYASFIFTNLKNFMCPALKVKKFEFWSSPFGGLPPILEPIIFVWFSLLLISTHSKNLIYLALMV